MMTSDGSIVEPGSGVRSEVELGENAQIGEYVLLGVLPMKAAAKTLVIGDNAVIRSHTVIYAGNVIGADFQTGHGVCIRENNVIGDNVSIGTHSVVERDNDIGDYVRIHTNCYIPEFVEIRGRAWLGPCVTILNVLHPPCPKFEECAKSVVIGENAKIGGDVTIGPRVHIGKNAMIGCGAVVTRDVPANAVAVGNPARVVKSLAELECILGYYKTPYEWE